jgi:hypothetical protein
VSQPRRFFQKRGTLVTSIARYFLAAMAAMSLLAVPSLAAPIIISAVESGTALNANVARYTGETYAHPNEGAAYTVPTLGEDVTVYTNRLHEYNAPAGYYDIPTLGLAGAEIVQIANENRDVANYTLTTTLSQAADVYLFMDFRVPQPSWLVSDGWQFLNLVTGIDEDGNGVGPGASVQNNFWIWKKGNVPAGTVVTRQRGASGNNMYGVAVLPAGAGPSELPFPTPGNFGVIDIGAIGGRAEPGALGGIEIGGGANNVNGTNLPPVLLTSLTGHPFTIALDNLDRNGVATGGLDWRDRGDAPSTGGTSAISIPLLRLAEDHVKNNLGILHMTLGQLPAGIYEMTAYTMDVENSQSERIQILVDNGNGSGYVDTGAVSSAVFPTPPGAASPFNPGGSGESFVYPDLIAGNIVPNTFATTFTFTADGVNNVQVLFDGTLATDREVPLAGLSINYVPEPASVLLVLMVVAFGALRLFVRRFR